MQVRFLNLLRDGFITSGKLSDKIKSDLSNLLRLVEKETATAGDKNFIIPKDFCVSNTFHLELLMVHSERLGVFLRTCFFYQCHLTCMSLFH